MIPIQGWEGGQEAELGKPALVRSSKSLQESLRGRKRWSEPQEVEDRALSTGTGAWDCQEVCRPRSLLVPGSAEGLLVAGAEVTPVLPLRHWCLPEGGGDTGGAGGLTGGFQSGEKEATTDHGGPGASRPRLAPRINNMD